MMLACEKELKFLLNDLQKRAKGHRFGWERFKGAFLGKGIRSAVGNLHRQCQVLNGMMSIDSAVLGAMTFKEVKEARGEQRQYYEAQIKTASVIKDSVDKMQKHQKTHTDALLGVEKGVNQLHSYGKDLECREEQTAILDWLTLTDYIPQQNDFFNRRQKGTGNWLLGSKEFKNWIDQDSQTLFCPGIPGAGKTIITSIVIDHLHTKFRDVPSVGIAYLYCSFQQYDTQKPADLLRSLLRQLVCGQPSVPETKALYAQYKNNRTQPPIDEISKALFSVVAKYSRVFIIVDALDECQIVHAERKKFLTEIFDLQSKTAANIFATSRFILEIQKEFKGSITVQISADRGDVERYVEEHISQLPAFVSAKVDLQEEIKTTIVNAVDGMFLLAQLHLASLIGKKSPKALRIALRELPAGSDAYTHAYEEAMERINGQDSDSRELARQVLSWVTCARRRLTISELQHAIAIEIGASELDEENFTEIEHMVTVCAGLVTVDNESGIVRLVHYTTQQYFERTWISWFPNAQMDMMHACITYLSFDIFEAGFCPTDEEFEKRLQLNVLYDYAARNWGHHACFMSTKEHLDSLILSFLRDMAKVEASSQALMSFQHSGHAYHSQEVPRNMTPLHLAAYFGIEAVVKALLNSQHPLDPVDSYFRTPLSWEAQRGHEGVVKLLVGNVNGSVDLRDEAGRTPLSYASEGGSKAVVEILLKTGVDSDMVDKYGRTPLSWAAENGHEAIVEHLLDGDKVCKDSKNGYGLTPLSWAAVRGHNRVTRLLLERGADANTTSKDGRTPLLWAAKTGNSAIVKMLLEKGSNINWRDKEGRTPLSHAVESGSDAVVKLLLSSHEIQPDLECRAGRTPLSYAAEGGHEVAELLLANTGVNPDSKDDDGWTPLMWAANEGKKSIVVRLLEDGRADPASRNTWKQTPLSRASRGGHVPVIALLLERNNIKLDSEDITGWTPLMQASMNGHQTAVDILLKAGANPNHKDSGARTPLSWAASLGHEAVVKRLLSGNTVNLDSRDEAGRTPMLMAAKKGHELVVGALITAGADLNAQDMYGKTALEVASKSGYHKIVELLLENDANADNGSLGNRWMALELAVIHGYRKVEDLLRAKGASEVGDILSLRALFE